MSNHTPRGRNRRILKIHGYHEVLQACRRDDRTIAERHYNIATRLRPLLATPEKRILAIAARLLCKMPLPCLGLHGRVPCGRYRVPTALRPTVRHLPRQRTGKAQTRCGLANLCWYIVRFAGQLRQVQNLVTSHFDFVSRSPYIPSIPCFTRPCDSLPVTPRKRPRPDLLARAFHSFRDRRPSRADGSGNY